MKLAGKRKLRKVRQTIYEDPGNPFAMDEHDDRTESEISVFNMPFGAVLQDPIGPTRVGTPSRSTSGSAKKHLPAMSMMQPGSVESLLSGKPFDDAVESPSVPPTPTNVVHAPTPQRHGTPTVIQNHRPSISVDVLSGQLTDENTPGDYVSTRGHWRRDSPPYREASKRNAPPKRDNARDTRFYGFHDDILGDYERTR